MSSGDPTLVIPAIHRDAAARALTATFGDTAVTAITPLTGGRSGALVYRVDLANTSAVMRVVSQRSPLSNPERQFAAMRAAAEAGVAPAVHYSDAEAGIVLTDFIAQRPEHEPIDNDPARLADLGRVVRALHDGPAMPAFLDALQCIDQALAGMRQAGVVLSPMLQRFLGDFEAVRAALMPHLFLGPSHNDLNPGNLLYDGRRLWIIDWESAWQNDPMFDVATVLHWFGFAGEKANALLEGYFGGTPTAQQLAKLELMRQVVSCYYALVFLLLPLQRGEVPPALDLDRDTLPSFAEARAWMRDRTIPLTSGGDYVRFSLIMVNEAMAAQATERFRSALTLLQNG